MSLEGGTQKIWGNPYLNSTFDTTQYKQDL